MGSDGGVHGAVSILSPQRRVGGGQARAVQHSGHNRLEPCPCRQIQYTLVAVLRPRAEQRPLQIEVSTGTERGQHEARDQLHICTRVGVQVGKETLELALLE